MNHAVVVGAGLRARLLVLYLLAALLGRAAVIDGGQVALVWPAAGIAVAWLVSEPARPAWLVDVPLLTAANAAAGLVIGTPWALLGVVVVSHLAGTVAVVLLVRLWSPDTGRRSLAPLDSPRTLVGFLAATACGCSAGVVVGGALLWLVVDPLGPIQLLTWWGRNVCAVVGVGTTTLMILHRSRVVPLARPDDGGRLEFGVVIAFTALLVGLDYVTALPVTFLLPAITVWVGMRFSPLVVAAHTLGGGAAVLLLTAAGRGPFATAPDLRTGTLLAQLFIAMTFVVGLFLAAMREQTSALQADLLAQERDRQEELRTFARRVAHDLRSPLTVIDSWTDELAGCLDRAPFGSPSGSEDLLTGIARASGRMRALVDDLLADATATDREPEPQDVQLDEIVRQVANDRGEPDAVQVNDVTVVRGDPVLIHQLVDNLLGNAFKYVRPGEPAEVAVTSRIEPGGRVVVRVADRGLGIPDDAHDWIFEPFRRAHGGDVPGTGLGLSTCRRIVERHGGRIRAESRLDGPGAAIEFDLPSAMGSVVPAATPAPRADADPPVHPWLADARQAG